MKKLFIVLFTFGSLNLSSLSSDVEQKVSNFNKTQTASALKGAACLFGCFSAAKISGLSAQSLVRNLRHEQYSRAFDNSVVAVSTLYASYFLLGRSIAYIKHALNINGFRFLQDRPVKE